MPPTLLLPARAATNAGVEASDPARELFERGEFRRALEIHVARALAEPAAPAHPLAMGTCLLALERPREAQASLERALELDSNCVEALFLLTGLFIEQGRSAEAFALCKRAFENAHRRPDLEGGIADLLVQLADKGGEDREAWGLVRAMCAADPERFAFSHPFMLPVMLESSAEGAALRGHLAAWMHAVAQQAIPLASPLHYTRTLFYLAYHGGNDRAIMEQQAQLLLRAEPRLEKDLLMPQTLGASPSTHPEAP